MNFGMGIPAPPGFQWMNSMSGGVPPNAVICGYDSGEPMYVGRAFHSGDLIPGKVHPSHGCCYVSYGGKEHSCRQYEVLCTFGSQPNWQNSYGNSIPPNAVQGGRTDTGEPLYIGRHMHQGSMVPGKIQPTHSCLYIPYGGEEHSYRDYEILVGSGGGGGGAFVPPSVPGYPSYPSYPNYPNPGYPSYPSYPGNQPRW